MGDAPDLDLVDPRRGRLDGPGTKRLTHLPIYLTLGVVCSFVIIMIIVGYNRREVIFDEDKARAQLGSSKSQAEELTRGYSGLISPVKTTKKEEQTPVEVPNEEAPNAPSIPVATLEVPDLDTPPVPPRLSGAVSEEDMYHLRAIRLQMFEQALQSKTGVESGANFPKSSSPSAAPSREEMLTQIASTRRQVSSVSSDEPTKAYKQRLDMLRNASLLSSDDSVTSFSGPLIANAPSGNGMPMMDSPLGDRWLLGGQGVTTPRTPFELRTGSVIPAIMLSGINSDLPGQVIAQVSQNVYDSATGKYLVIPQGTRLIGAYGNDVGFGQERILIAWQRLIFPDGKALDIGSMPGADSAGYTGFHDKVNTHMFRTIASAFLLSGVVASINLSQDRGGSSENQRASDALSEALGQTLGQAVAQVIMKNMNVAPTLEIRPGYRFNVMVVKDIPFQNPFKSFDY